MNQRLEKDIAEAIHHLNREQLLEVKRYVKQLRSNEPRHALIEEDELDMLLEVMTTNSSYQ